jgi:succinylglutamic semialdehyde dehydrogenase
VLAELFADALDAEGWGTQGTGGGVFNLVQGGADVAQAMTSHADIDGILFTGSWAVGRRILEANLDHPGRMIALEMGGSNAAVVMEDADLKQAAIEVIRCAFNTAGQRCTCTRRVIVHAPIAGRFIRALTLASKAVVFGPPRDKDVLAGPVITGEARDAVLSFQRRLLGAGAESLVESAPMNVPGAPGGFFVSPGLVRVARFAAIDESDPRAAATRGGWDEEVFGPLLRVSVARDLDDAIAQANATRYGLAASIFTSSDASATRFLHEARAGCVNVNAGTAGASSKLPFGGLGISGNHRPAGSFALDCCAYPVAMMIERSNAAQVAQGMRFDDAWLA